MAYTAGQLKGLAKAAGFPDDKLDIMAAISLAESSGDPNARNPKTGAINPKTGELSIGLWQINIAPKLKRPYTEAQLKNPSFNAQIAYKIYKVEGLGAWGAYTDKRYLKYLTDATHSNIDGSTTAPAIDDNTNTIIVIALVAGLIWYLQD